MKIDYVCKKCHSRNLVISLNPRLFLAPSSGLSSCRLCLFVVTSVTRLRQFQWAHFLKWEFTRGKREVAKDLSSASQHASSLANGE